jgi:hypothetical protein
MPKKITLKKEIFILAVGFGDSSLSSVGPFIFGPMVKQLITVESTRDRKILSSWRLEKKIWKREGSSIPITPQGMLPHDQKPSQ